MADKMDKWMKNSWTFQQEMFKMFGKRKWDSLNDSVENLRKKLVIPFEYRFGEKYLSNPTFEKITDRVENQLLKLFYDKRYNENFDCTFINLKKKDDEEDEELITCVFWLQDGYGSERCVDLDGRDYKSWEDFIENNIFSKYYMIYPKYGRYYHSCKEHFADIILDESVACGTRRTVKNVFDVITTIGGIAATGVLVCNPVSGPLILGATAVAAASGVYGAGNSIRRLVDIEKHEGGLSLEESKTLFAVGELAINVAGTAAIGVSAGIKGLTATTGKVLSEGSIALRIANSFSKVARVVSCFNVGFNFIVAIDKFSIDGELTIHDIAHLSKVLLYGFNVFATDQLISKLIHFLADNVPRERFIDYFITSVARRAFEGVRKFYEFCSENHLYDLILVILPDFKFFPKLIQLINPGISGRPDFINQTLSLIKTGDLSIASLKKISFPSTSSSDGDKVKENERKIKEALEIKKRKENVEKIKKRFDKQVYDIIEEWSNYFNIDLFDDSNFVCTLEEFEETVKRCCKFEESEDLEKKANKLLCLCLCQINSEDVDSSYAIFKMNFYCNAFELLYEDLIKPCYYEYFRKYHKKNDIMNKKLFFHQHYATQNIHDNIFFRSVIAFVQNTDNLKKNFEMFRTFNDLTKA